MIPSEPSFTVKDYYVHEMGLRLNTKRERQVARAKKPLRYARSLVTAEKYFLRSVRRKGQMPVGETELIYGDGSYIYQDSIYCMVFIVRTVEYDEEMQRRFPKGDLRLSPRLSVLRLPLPVSPFPFRIEDHVKYES